MFNKRNWKKAMETEVLMLNEQLTYEQDIRKKLFIGIAVTAFSGLLGIATCSHKIKRLEDEDERLRQIRVINKELKEMRKELGSVKSFCSELDDYLDDEEEEEEEPMAVNTISQGRPIKPCLRAVPDVAETVESVDSDN